MNESYEAFLFVKQCTIPMIVANAVSVGLSLFIVAMLSKEKIIRRGKDNGIAQTFQRWLFICIVLAYFVTSLFTYNLQTGIAEKQVESSFTTTMTDVITDVKLKSETSMERIAKTVKKAYEHDENVDLTTLLLGKDETGETYEICEINVVSAKGIITKSTDATNIVGFNFYSQENGTFPRRLVNLVVVAVAFHIVH